MRTRDLQNSAAMAVLHGYRHWLLWAHVGPAMLAPYAHHPVYLNVSGLHGCHRRHRVQVGRREWGDPFQRSAPRECSESGAEGSSDFQCSEDFHVTVTSDNTPERADGQG